MSIMWTSELVIYLEVIVGEKYVWRSLLLSDVWRSLLVSGVWRSLLVSDV